MAATTTSSIKKKDRKNSNEPVLPYKRERNKINSLARALQLEHALYQDETAMRFAAIYDQINNVDKKIEGLRLDMQAAIHNEFMYLANKMLLKHQSDNNVELDYGCVTGRRPHR
jgi:hypothetical protein